MGENGLERPRMGNLTCYGIIVWLYEPHTDARRDAIYTVMVWGVPGIDLIDERTSKGEDSSSVFQDLNIPGAGHAVLNQWGTSVEIEIDGMNLAQVTTTATTTEWFSLRLGGPPSAPSFFFSRISGSALGARIILMAGYAVLLPDQPP